MGKMTNMVKDVHGALMDEEDGSEGGDSSPDTSGSSDGTPDDFLVGSASSNINRLPSGEILRDEGHAIRFGQAILHFIVQTNAASLTNEVVCWYLGQDLALILTTSLEK